MTVSVLMVAEKPSICTAIAHALAGSGAMETRGRSPPVHEFQHTFMGMPAFMRVTSVTGHVFSTDFPAHYQNWDAIDPLELYSAPVLHSPDGKGGIVKHLEREARGMDYLVLWLDCDREGENICFEVIRCVTAAMKQPQSFRQPSQFSSKGSRYTTQQNPQTIFRARFSAVTPKDIEKAMLNLVEPNENESLAVDARQELDLKIGVSFSRFQTRYFQGKYGNLDSSVISYGPCQTPTLGFCVDRYDEIQAFKSRPYHCIDATLEIRGRMLSLTCDRGRMFDKNVCDNLLQQLGSEKELTCVDIKISESRKSRPQPLNTVELLKLASRNLGIGPQATMRAAEHLYLSGYLSYPRTESTAYPSSFDFRDVLHIQRAHPDWGSYCTHLLSKGHTQPKHGHDAGDHPPITPVGLALPHEMVTSDNARIYELVTRHFFATISPDAIFQCTKAKFSAPNCDEMFTLRGKKEVNAGFLHVYRTCVGNQQQYTVDEDGADGGGDGADREEGADSGGLLDLPDLERGKGYRLAVAKSRQGATRAPGYLSESDLIGLMEQHGIGTDASIPSHINNITVRNYVTLGQGRTLVPTELGIVLVHGYQRIDPQLVLPDTRAAIEASCDRIAKGLDTKEKVLNSALLTFQCKFEHFRQHIGAMDSLFEATFSPLAATGKNMSKCGRCSRYMRYIPMRPQRLHCPTCAETYALPQNGTIKLYKELKCPLDQFELVLFSLGNTAKAQGKSYPLCPCCYNQPPVFLSPEEVAQAEGAATAAGIALPGWSTQLSTTTAVTSCTKAALAQQSNMAALQSGVSNMKLSAGSAGPVKASAQLSILDIEDHRGVKIRRRVKEGVKQDSEAVMAAVSSAKSAATATATVVTVPAAVEPTPVVSAAPPPAVAVAPALAAPPGLQEPPINEENRMEAGGRGQGRPGRSDRRGRVGLVDNGAIEDASASANTGDASGHRGAATERGGRGRGRGRGDWPLFAEPGPSLIDDSSSRGKGDRGGRGGRGRGNRPQFEESPSCNDTRGGGRGGRGGRGRGRGHSISYEDSALPEPPKTQLAAVVVPASIAATTSLAVVPPAPQAQLLPPAPPLSGPAPTIPTEDSGEEENIVENMGCNSCMHPTCKQSAVQNMICECPGDDRLGQPCKGMLILDVNSKPNWKLACNQYQCNTLIRIRGDIHNITPQPKIPCPECGIRTAVFEFNKLRTPLPDGATTHVGCVLCDEFLNSITEVVAGRAVNLLVVRQERYKRGGGGRGRGRGRGRRGGRDVKMSFSDF